MKQLWAPWRIEYIRQEPEPGCIFCNRLKRRTPRKDLVLYRTSRVLVMLNRYPYNPGHLLISPTRHTGELADLSPSEQTALLGAVERSLAVLKKCLNPEGFNLGMNLERVGGAGVPEHLHFHLVPRWTGDTNFMPVLTGVKVIPENLERMFLLLRPAFGEEKKKGAEKRNKG